jgi:hypothetical protein
MLVTINFGTPFAGRVFATGNPQSCFEMGGDRSQVVLRISLGTQCGTLQQVGRASALIETSRLGDARMGADSVVTCESRVEGDT